MAGFCGLAKRGPDALCWILFLQLGPANARSTRRSSAGPPRTRVGGPGFANPQADTPSAPEFVAPFVDFVSFSARIMGIAGVRS